MNVENLKKKYFQALDKLEAEILEIKKSNQEQSRIDHSIANFFAYPMLKNSLHPFFQNNEDIIQCVNNISNTAWIKIYENLKIINETDSWWIKIYQDHYTLHCHIKYNDLLPLYYKMCEYIKKKGEKYGI